jgi:hypothetical protein
MMRGARAWSQARVRALLMREGVHWSFSDCGHRGLCRPNLNGALRRSTIPSSDWFLVGPRFRELKFPIEVRP